MPIVGFQHVFNYLEERWKTILKVVAGGHTGGMLIGKVDLPKSKNYPSLVFQLDGRTHALWK